MGTRWRGMLAPLGVPTGDDRRFLPSGITFRELPIALKWQREDEPGHDNSVVIGLVETITIEDDGVWGEGELFDDVSPQEMPRLAEDVAEAKLLLAKKVIGPSVDAGSFEVVRVRVGSDEPLSADELEKMYWDEMESGEAAPIELLFTEYEISAATLVTIPAFAECRPFELFEEALTAAVRRSGWDDMPLGDREAEWDGSAAEKRIADDAGIGGDNPDWGRYAEAFLHQDDEADPETKGAYGFQIVDLVNGERTIMPRAVFTVAGVLQGSMGGTNIPDQDQQNMKEVVASLYERMADEFDDDTIMVPWDASSEAACNPGRKKKTTSAALLESLTAAASRVYDLSLFMPPAEPSRGLVNITVTEDGKVFGHIATHDVCHIGIPGVCMTAPVDMAEFDRFHRYSLPGSDGEPIAVGRITYGAGQFVNDCGCSGCRGNDDHACSRLSMGGAIAHHDKMSTVAWVRAWEDEENNAIRVAGVLADGVTAEQIRALSRGKVSGDWRAVGTDLALVEILTLSRERPGFPLPRARMIGRTMMALTAAGAVIRREPESGDDQVQGIDYERLASMIADRLAPALAGVRISDTDTTPTDDPQVVTDSDTGATSAEASDLVAEIGVIFASRDEVKARRLAGEVETITHVLR